MSEAYMREAWASGSAWSEIRNENGSTVARAAGWLNLAAAPTFVIMALLTGVFGGSNDVLCTAAQEAPPLSGMALMYLLMSAFHSAPWLKLMSSRRIDARLQ